LKSILEDSAERNEDEAATAVNEKNKTVAHAMTPERIGKAFNKNDHDAI
jgi:hypothetical protein